MADSKTTSTANRAAIRKLQISAGRELAGLLAGACRSRFRGQGMEFSDLRPYQPGDDIRRIDWSATARTGLPYTRIYEEERSRSITLLADISLSCSPAKRQLLYETAGLLAFAAVAGGDRIALIAFSDRVERLVRPGRGVRQAQRIAGELLTLRPTGSGTDLQPALHAARGLNRRPGLLILLSDLHCTVPLPLFREIAAKHDLVTLLLRDADEVTPPAAGLTLFQDAETAELRLLDLTSQKIRAAITKNWQSCDDELRQNLQKIRTRSTFLQSDRPPLPELIRLFRQEGRR
jgi:uncharacterized protein (DUF58 family)